MVDSFESIWFVFCRGHFERQQKGILCPLLDGCLTVYLEPGNTLRDTIIPLCGGKVIHPAQKI